MAMQNELLVSASDAEVLATLVGDRRRTGAAEADAMTALADALMDARMVPHERLPADRVAMNSAVEYREEPSGRLRSVVLAHPNEADPAAGRISVLSPVGRALLGRQAGAVASIAVPGGRAMTIRVVRVAQRAPVEVAS